MELYEWIPGTQTRWVSFENQSGQRGMGGIENNGAKGHPFDNVLAGETKTLLDLSGSGSVRRIWMTINDRSPEMLRSLRIDMYWDGDENPAVSVPLGDFFGVALGRKTPFENAFFSDPEGRSFNSFIPMPFRTHARITITNESNTDLPLLFYDIDLVLGQRHSEDVLYFHAHWRRESPNKLGKDFEILPTVQGFGRFLGCNLGVITNPQYAGSWWGEGEVKCWFGDETYPTLCGTGTEDYIGTGWGQGYYAQRTQGCLIADSKAGQWAFYRYHVDDPVFFEPSCRVSIQTIGGTDKAKVIGMIDVGIPVIPVTVDTAKPGGFTRLMDLAKPVDLHSPELPEGWCNFWRQDDWCSTAYFYLNSPGGQLPPLAPVAQRVEGLSAVDSERESV